MTLLLEATDISIHRRLQSTSISVEAGTLIALIGSNGSGKTSLLRALADIELSSGVVHVDGEELSSVPATRRKHLVSFLPASRDLVWPIRARDVISLGLTVQDDQRVDYLLQELELNALTPRPANQLSTGERARVLLARALAPLPRLLLLDEPLSNLDPYWVLRTIDLLRELIEGSGCSAIVSLHDIDKTQAFDRALLMNHGRLVADRNAVDMLASDVLADCFRIEKQSGEWRVRTVEDRQSSP